MAKKVLHQPKIALHIIADELRVNPDQRCGREIFESAKKNLPDTRGRSLKVLLCVLNLATLCSNHHRKTL